jgi:hypothetical protein
MKKEIIKFLTMKRKVIPLQKQILYFIPISAILIANIIVLHYLARSQFFSQKEFLFFLTSYILVLLGVGIIINRKERKLSIFSLFYRFHFSIIALMFIFSMSIMSYFSIPGLVSLIVLFFAGQIAIREAEKLEQYNLKDKSSKNDFVQIDG